MYFLGIDLGSSSVKVALIHGDTNKLIASAYYPKREMEMIAVQPGWAEQDPTMWWEATKSALIELMQKAQIQKEAIKGIGISYQMHGLVCVDKDMIPVRPSIIWCDSRAVNIGDKAFKDLGEENCLSSLLNSPGNFTAAKLAWVKQNEPHIYDKIHKVMLPGDYLAMRMSGIPQTTFSGLSEGIFYDFTKGRLSKEIMEYYGFEDSLIPTVVDTFSEQSALSEKAARELGLQAGTKISYRAGDQPNNALSLNVLRPGEVAATAGTSGVVYGVSDALDTDPLSRVNAFAHVNHHPERHRIGVLLCINGTGILYSWARKNLNVASYEEMNALSSGVEPGSKGLIVLPFGNGAERILSNKNLGASIHQLHLNIHDKTHLLRAMKEGIAFSFRYGLDIMSQMGLTANVIRAGRANMFLSETFASVISTLANAEIELFDTDGSQGAARGAGIGAGFYTLDEAFEGLKLRQHIQPSAAHRNIYESAYARWKDQLESLLS